MAGVLSAVHHAEVVAHKVDEPFGTIILAVAITLLEASILNCPITYKQTNIHKRQVSRGKIRGRYGGDSKEHRYDISISSLYLQYKFTITQI
jgi:hypothetical protein